jgi:drug/metabolite transporter (DMT)-like permease
MPGALTGAGLSLAAAGAWGGGDFCGSLCARHQHPVVVVASVALSGSVLLLALALLRGEGMPGASDIGWSVAAGICGAAGLAALYRALAIGHAAVVAPAASVVGALVPVVYGLVLAKAPAPLQVIGFAVALAGIVLVTRTGGDAHTRHGLGTAAAAGVALGSFLVLMAQVDRAGVFAPLLLARLVMLAAALAAMRRLRVTVRGRSGLALALAAGMLDTTGNVLYLLATHYTRIDVAGVLVSLYPVFTVILSRTLLAQPVHAVQWAGVALCAVAVALIAP